MRERERGAKQKREEVGDRYGENLKKKVFYTILGFSKLGREKLEIQKVGREKKYQSFSWSKFHQVLSFTEHIKVVLFLLFPLILVILDLNW